MEGCCAYKEELARPQTPLFKRLETVLLLKLGRAKSSISHTRQKERKRSTSLLTLALYPSGESEGPVCVPAVSGRVWPIPFFSFIFSKKTNSQIRRTVRSQLRDHQSVTATVWHLKWPLAILKWPLLPPLNFTLSNLNLEIDEPNRWTNSAKKTKIFEWKKPRKHFTMTLGTKKSIHKSICDRFYNPSNSP